MGLQRHGGCGAQDACAGESYTDLNARIIDQWIADGWEWGTPISHERYLAALEGDWSMVLTPVRTVPRDWFFADMRGRRVLGLAAGGGQQMPLFAAMGAVCTVLDYSERQVASERLVAEHEGYEIRVVRADMTRPLPFDDGEFDLIFHPVSNCYVEDVLPIWRECFRVLAPGGRLLAGLDNGFNYVVDDDEERIVRGLPYNPLLDPSLISEDELPEWGVQFSHTMDEQIRGQIQAGFRLLDLYEDTNGSGRLHELGIPSFWATLAEKPGDVARGGYHG
ncbi:SAM-dependent methyltransferase [Collinsella sp. An271]|uniref:class I SAM-dependent methyltransferase n=1 Tax=Collinsella sp. An271 TaxID=1965616 RepID=UPI000B36FFC4|nr:class I SAM-dependent methyltransferase [Collinsella sp. An271]MBM6776108.1 class I SAM-dependent methyltransferase [Collinsella tanakaei]OUO58994.1 SAM-dependent methyltransferase [Collinsella sp. An271]